MKPTKLAIADLFQQRKRFVVPLYQRTYCWSRDDQWEPLWEDIEKKAAEFLAGATPAPHFLGAVVLHQIPTFGKQIAASQIIDGQQRLTTYQILLAAFRDVVDERARALGTNDSLRELLQGIHDGVVDLTEHRGLMESPIEKLKVWPTNADRGVFQQVMSARSQEEVEKRFPRQFKGKRKRTPLDGPLLVEAYRLYSSLIRGFVDAVPPPAEPDRHPLLALYKALQGSFQLVAIELEEKDDPQVIFETLNARGAPLLPSDLIRNFVFSRSTATADGLYDTYWRPFDALDESGSLGFWREEVKQGRVKRPRLDLFFQHFLTCQANREILIGHLFDAFRSWWDAVKPVRDVESGLKDIQRYSVAYRWFQTPEELAKSDPVLSSFLSRLLTLDTSTVYPLMLFLLVNMKEEPRANRDLVLLDLESYLVRRWLCGLPTKNYNRMFGSVLNEMRQAGTLDPASVRARLLGLTGDEGRWPADAEFRTSWLQLPAYQRVKSPGVRMVLAAIHQRMLTSKQEKVIVDQAELTVEHVMPQGWVDHWGEPVAALDDYADARGEDAVERRNRMLHTFGNLTLVTQALNSDVSNGPMPSKREALRKSLLLLNDYFLDLETWAEEEILLRGEALLDIARTIWPHPGKPMA